MKIQLQSLRVVNCGSLRDDCIQFNTLGDSPTTVLAGANGSGKTTIIESVFELLALLDPKFPLEQINRVSQAALCQLEVIVDDDLVWVTVDEYHAVHGQHSIPEAIIGLQGRHIMLEGDEVKHIQEAIIQQTKSSLHNGHGDAASKAIEQSEADLPCILYLPHLRFMTQVEGTQVTREQIGYKWAYRYENAPDFEGSLDSYLIWLDYAEPETYAQVINFLNSLDFDGKKFGVQRKELRAVVTTRDGQTHGVSELSSGEQNILIMLLELRRRLLPYSIVLIDEIENSLHAAFQHRLGQALRKMQADIPFQLIVTTHSSEFARIFGPESVRVLTEF